MVGIFHLFRGLGGGSCLVQTLSLGKGDVWGVFGKRVHSLKGRLDLGME